ncbi:hypothetical protein CRUP_030749, partial [Coryphaenoides rupestris]
LPGAQVTLAGGFRRGKTSGHDADFLITHPIEGEEEGLLRKVIACLESRGLLLYHQTTRNSYQEAPQGPGRPSSSMDHFETCFSIFKLTNHSHPEDTKRQLQVKGDQDPAQVQVASGSRPWRAVRVDLVVSPISQFAFALLGWTGSKKRYLRASSEQEIFAHLGLEYVSPSGRNA